ncbi:MAG: hypothetical protein DRQ62_14945 [Gammaproteobacteria bacterium]|nr:MAG: hypothetical protein DRQ62_14945 [Gammaproteobacteria bacterium]
MNAHKLIEFIENYQPKDDQQANDMLYLADLIDPVKSSIKFQYDGDLIPFNEREMLQLAKEVKLPYELCYFEFYGSSILAREHVDDCILFQVFFNLPGKNWLIIPPKIMLVLDTTIGRIFPLKNQQLFSEISKEKQLAELIGATVGFMIRFLVAFNCSNTYIENNSPSIKLQKSRIKKGKLPLFEYKTLHINMNNTRVKKQPGAGTHASPKVHLRRGHIRKLEKEDIWVQPCVVGSKENGIIYKDYDVT